MIDLDKLQAEILEWRKKNFGEQDGTLVLKHMATEMAELAIAHGEDDFSGERDAVADILICLLGYCGEQNIGLADALVATWEVVRERDYVKYPGRGRP